MTEGFKKTGQLWGSDWRLSWISLCGKWEGGGRAKAKAFRSPAPPFPPLSTPHQGPSPSWAAPTSGHRPAVSHPHAVVRLECLSLPHHLAHSRCSRRLRFLSLSQEFSWTERIEFKASRLCSDSILSLSTVTLYTLHCNGVLGVCFLRQIVSSGGGVAGGCAAEHWCS